MFTAFAGFNIDRRRNICQLFMLTEIISEDWLFLPLLQLCGRSSLYRSGNKNRELQKQ
jgi:hypothetical protein